MNTSTLLTPDEVVEITGKRKASAQCRVLVKMGVRHVVRPDGRVLVSREVLAALLGRVTDYPAPSARPRSVINDAALIPKRARKRS